MLATIRDSNRHLPQTATVKRSQRGIAPLTLTDGTTTPFVEQFKRDADAMHQRLIIRQHLGWLKIYTAGMNEHNWHDMKGRIEHQTDELSRVLLGDGELARDAKER